MKSYLRHSKDRRVRGSANGAATVCVCLPGEANIFSQDGNFFSFLIYYRIIKAPCPPPRNQLVYLPPDDTRVGVFCSCGPHVKYDEVLITELLYLNEPTRHHLNCEIFNNNNNDKQVYSCEPHICIVSKEEL